MRGDPPATLVHLLHSYPHLLHGELGRTELLGVAKDAPGGHELDARSPGLHLLAYRAAHRFRPIRLPAQKPAMPPVIAIALPAATTLGPERIRRSTALPTSIASPSTEPTSRTVVTPARKCRSALSARRRAVRARDSR